MLTKLSKIRLSPVIYIVFKIGYNFITIISNIINKWTITKYLNPIKSLKQFEN